MNGTFKIARYSAHDTLRSKWVLGYGLLVLLTTDLLLRFGGGGPKALLSLSNVVLLLVPLVSILFGALQVYNGRAFVEMLLAQPVRRRDLYAGLGIGTAAPLALAFVVGSLMPFALHRLASDAGTLLLLMGLGAALTLIFVGLSIAITAYVDDRARGFGLALVVWLVLAIVYDGLVLLVVQVFADYPLEKPVIALMMLNPIDLARVLLLMQFDASALLGYTGAVFERFFGSAIGPGVAAIALALWLVAPFLLGRRRFERKDI